MSDIDHKAAAETARELVQFPHLMSPPGDAAGRANLAACYLALQQTVDAGIDPEKFKRGAIRLMYARLGVVRDSMSADEVLVVQNFLGPLPETTAPDAAGKIK